MANGISKLQVRTATFDSTRMMDYNYFARARALKPEIFNYADRLLFASKSGGKNYANGQFFESFFGFGKTKWIDDLSWGWKIGAKGDRPLTILENMTSAEYGDKPGIYRSEIKLRVDNDLGVKGESWNPGAFDKSQILRLESKYKMGDKGYVYIFKTYTEGSDHYIKPKWLVPGVTWTRSYNLRGEAAETGSHTETYGNIEFKNHLGKFRKQYDVTDFGAQAQATELVMRTDDGKLITAWQPAAETVYDMAMRDECWNYMMNSRLGDDPIPDPDSKYPILPAAGFHQQVELGGNVEYYNNLSTEIIEALFNKMVYSRISPGELGEVIGWSGQYGMQLFSKALDRWNGGKSIIREGDQFFSPDTKGWHDNSLTQGYSFTRYRLPTGGSVRLIHCPLYDNKKFYRELSPINGLPMASQVITFSDITGGNAESIAGKDNIFLVRKNKVAGTTIIEGRYGPGGGISTRPSHAGDYYSVHKSDSIGIQITDPTITAEFRPLEAI